MNTDTPSDPVPEDYADLIALARTLSVADTHLDTPPDDLWRGIEALLVAGDPALAGAHPLRGDGSVTSIGQRRGQRSQRLPFFLGAAAAALVAVVGLVAFVRSDAGPGGRVVEEVALTNNGLSPEGAASRAKATLVQVGTGEYALDVNVQNLPLLNDGFLELWIIDTKVKGMYSLGPLHGSGRYALPEHVQPAGFPIVDVSIEPADGEPQHSGKSILRGQLTL